MDMNIINQEDRAKVKAYIKQATEVVGEIKDKQAELKDIKDVLKQEFEVSPAVSGKLINDMYAGNTKNTLEANEMFSDLHEIATARTSDGDN